MSNFLGSVHEGVRGSFERSEELSRMERSDAEVRNTRPVATERSGRERPKEKIVILFFD